MSKLIYLAGPLGTNSKCDSQVQFENVKRACEWAERIHHQYWGAPQYEPVRVYIPHLSWFHATMCGASFSRDFWLKLDEHWVRASDFLVRMPGDSTGADNEVRLANELNIPVIHADELYQALLALEQHLKK